CDDGNMKGGDGCSAICQIPSGWSCTGSPSICSMAGVCGDGILGATEACDDGNANSGDGCSGDCKTVEGGFECRVPGRPCVPACAPWAWPAGRQGAERVLLRRRDRLLEDLHGRAELP